MAAHASASSVLPRVLRFSLVTVLVLTGLSAVWGGSALMRGAWQMDPAWLRHTPFADWTMPGLATIVLPGVGVLLAALWTGARLPHHRSLAIAAGVGLVAWVVVELAWLQVLHPVLHPLILAVGLAVIVLGRRLPGATASVRAAPDAALV